MRVQARKPATYWARSAWGLAAALFLALVLWLNQQIISDGSVMFSLLHGSLAAMLFLSAPIICADTISRERREGSLGLLLLTPLTPMQIVHGKFFSHLLRLLYFWLMMVPFLMMPMIIGGVSLSEFLLSAAILFSMLVAGLSAGLIASALSISFGAALVGSLILAVVANHLASTIATHFPFLVANSTRFRNPVFIQLFLVGPAFAFVPTLLTQNLLQRLFATRYLYEMLGSGMIVTSMLGLWFAIRFAAFRIARFGQFDANVLRQQKFRRRFLSPIVAKSFFRRSLKRKLETNPFAWLEYRTPWSRVAIRITVALLILFEFSVLIDESRRELFNAQIPFLFLLLFAIAIKSASSFQYEKENGAFELLLVTPLKEHDLVANRLRAVTRYFLPLSLILMISMSLSFSRREFGEFLFPVVSVGPAVRISSLWLSIITIPAAGLFFSLRFKSLITALAWTVLFGIFSAPFLWGCFGTLLWYLGYRLSQQWAIDLDQFLQAHWSPPIIALILYHLTLTTIFRRFATNLIQRRAFADPKTA